jgi:drug/metabolite transporter (DMT)-like permease
MSSPPAMGPGATSSRDAFIGVSWALAAFLCYSMVPVGVRMAGSHLPPIEILFFRNVIGFVVFFAFFVWRGFGSLKTDHFGLHLQRNVANFVGMWLWFAALAVMPLAKAVTLHFTEPVMAAILAVLILKERPGYRRFVAMGGGLVGVLIVLRPGSIAIGWPVLAVLGSALLYGCVSIYTRFLGRTEAASTTTFYYQAMLTAFSLPPAIWLWVTPGLDDVPGILMVGIFGSAAPYFIIRALRHAETTLISPLGFLRLPFTAGFAWLLFSEPTEIWTWIGAAVIFSTAYFMTRGEAVKMKNPAPR